MKKITLNNGMDAIVDDKHYVYLSQFRWIAIKASNGRYYAVRSEKINGKHVIIRMHREIMNVTCSKTLVDHKDMDTLNNCEDNLRIADKSKNAMNRGKQRNNTTGFKGVFLCKKQMTYVSYIRVRKKGIYLGRFKTAIEAANAYNKAALLYHGEFANVNENI